MRFSTEKFTVYPSGVIFHQTKHPFNIVVSLYPSGRGRAISFRQHTGCSGWTPQPPLTKYERRELYRRAREILAREAKRTVATKIKRLLITDYITAALMAAKDKNEGWAVEPDTPHFLAVYEKVDGQLGKVAVYDDGQPSTEYWREVAQKLRDALKDASPRARERIKEYLSFAEKEAMPA